MMRNKYTPQPNIAQNDPTRLQPSREVVTASSEKLTVSTGPIPSPDTLAAYNKALPGLGERIVASYEAEFSHRHQMDRLSLEGDIDAMSKSHLDIRRGSGSDLLLRSPDWWQARQRYF